MIGSTSISSETIRLQFTKCDLEVRHFRCLADIQTQTDSKVVKTGLEKLYFSGSGQFGAEHLPLIMQKVKKVCSDVKLPELWCLDLRAERHLFVNGKPVVWKQENIKQGETVKAILQDEDQRIAQIGKMVLIWDRNDVEVKVNVENISNERNLVEAAGFQYARFPMIEHHRPTDECVDGLVQFFLTHPHAWIHMHCYVSHRTTLALVIADMIYNAQQVSFEDILYRAKAIGGSDLMKMPAPSSENHLHAQESLTFLRNFYCYCQETNPSKNSQVKIWSEWSGQKSAQK